MNHDLSGRTALVTGAGQGIGEGIARRLAAAGAAVTIAELNPETGRKVADSLCREGHQARFTATDIGNEDNIRRAVRQVVEESGKLDILVNNAYPTHGMPMRLERRDNSSLEGAFRSGLMGVWWAMQEAFASMKAQRWGRIINICSLNGVNAHPYTADYNIAKEAVRALSRTAAREWAAHRICVNILCPAARTAAYEHFAAADPENAARMLGENPMGYMGDPAQDIGGVALFLASEDARYLTGNTLFVDGGSHINGVSWQPEVD